MSKVSTWHNSQACYTVSQYGITEDDIICRPCRDDVRWIAANPSSHTPRWEKRRQEKKCHVKECDNKFFTQTKATDKITITTIFSELDLQTEGEEIPFPTPLCSQHYYTFYQKLQPQQTNCPSCSISLKNTSSRPCPNPKVIEEHLQNVAGFDVTINSTDRVCYNCYKYHLLILHKEQQQGNDLPSIVREYKQKVATMLARDTTVMLSN